MPDAVIHLRVPAAVKGRWVRESRASGKRLTDWIIERVDAMEGDNAEWRQEIMTRAGRPTGDRPALVAMAHWAALSDGDMRTNSILSAQLTATEAQIIIRALRAGGWNGQGLDAVEKMLAGLRAADEGGKTPEEALEWVRRVDAIRHQVGQ